MKTNKIAKRLNRWLWLDNFLDELFLMILRFTNKFRKFPKPEPMPRYIKRAMKLVNKVIDNLD